MKTLQHGIHKRCETDVVWRRFKIQDSGFIGCMIYQVSLQTSRHFQG